MFKLILLGGFVGVALLLSPVTAQAQAQKLTSQSPTQSPAASNITPLELRQFAQVILQWQAIDKESQKKMPQIIKDGGMSIERFIEIGKIQESPSSSSAATVSPEEQEKFKNIVAKFNQLEIDSRPKKERAVTTQGLTVQRFIQIDQIVQQDPALKQRLQQMVVEK